MLFLNPSFIVHFKIFEHDYVLDVMEKIYVLCLYSPFEIVCYSCTAEYKVYLTIQNTRADSLCVTLHTVLVKGLQVSIIFGIEYSVDFSHWLIE